jgi:hypothetical protein
MFLGLEIYKKVPEDIQKYITNYYDLIGNRIIERNLFEYKIPKEIYYLILTYLNTNYTFDHDSVFISFEPLVFIVDNRLQVSLYSWYGTQNPNNYNPNSILHTIFDRPYSIRLERKFRNIARNIYDGIKHLNFREDIIEKDFSFIGTYGPMLNRGILRDTRPFFKKLANANWHYSTADIYNYFKELDVIDNSINNLNEEIINSSIKSISELIEKSVEKSMSNFNSSNNSTITGPFYNKYSEFEGGKKIFYKIEKIKSDQQYIIEKNMLNQIIKNNN